jgi:nucleoid DNA-binding protein
MTAVSKVLREIVDALREEKAREMVDFARFRQRKPTI